MTASGLLRYTGAITLHGDLGNDTLIGSPGNDVMQGLNGDDWMEGRGGNDTMYAYYGNDTMYGGDGNDWMHGDFDDDLVDGGIGNDTLYGGDGNDTMQGLTGNDWMDGGSGNDIMYAYYGNDTMYGSDGNDWMHGDFDNDGMDGGTGNDTLYGGAGSDWMHGNYGDDWLAGGGSDFGGDGNDTLYGGAGNDHLEGWDGDDYMDGEGGNDSLYGGYGNDILYGQGGNDTLDGQYDNDGLFGGWDVDTVTGGDGADRFLDYTHTETSGWWIFQTTTRKWDDTITDGNWSVDARIGFENGEQVSFLGDTYAAAQWADWEVQLIDSALAVLHRATNNTKLLKKHDGGLVIFVRYGDAFDGAGSAWNDDGTIGYPGRIQEADFERHVVFHEMGHNWDTEFSGSTWMALSGWTSSDKSKDPNYLRGGDPRWFYLAAAHNQFVSEYARYNPLEDFADSFDSYFMNLGGFSQFKPTDISLIPSKKAFLDNMVAALS